jgi:hypothetical protein
MDSAMIAKISKACEYSQEPERITFKGYEVAFQGKHQVYTVSFDHGEWRCHAISAAGVCSHTMTLSAVGVSGVTRARQQPSSDSWERSPRDVRVASSRRDRGP